jgi:cobalamin biosynthesis Mg chelatase CobN
MKHFILVLTIILFVLLTFLHPSIIEDASFNDYTYLRNLRRSNNSIDNEYTKKKLHENTIFNTASGSTASGSMGTSSTGSSAGSTAASVGFAPILYNTTPTVKKDQTVHSETESKSKSSTNLLPYLLLLLILVIVIIVYIKYKMN